MGLFKKKKKEEKQVESKVILSMPMFAEGEKCPFEKVVEDLKNYWELKISDVDMKEDILSFVVNQKDTVFVALMPAPLPEGEFDGFIEVSYLWKNVKEEIKTHTTHAIVTMMSTDTPTVERYSILTKVNASILRVSENAIGIYQGMQTLLLPKNLYLDFADFLLDEMSPIMLWVYIGLIRGENDKNSAYTYGLKEFGRQEIEVIDSDFLPSELQDFLNQITAYLIDYDVTLKDGETIGFSEEQKLSITESDGVYLDGKTLKIKY